LLSLHHQRDEEQKVPDNKNTLLKIKGEKTMSTKKVLYFGLAAVVAALSVWDFVHGDFVWGAILAGCAVLNVTNAFLKPVER